jgi:hypothetical protein
MKVGIRRAVQNKIITAVRRTYIITIAWRKTIDFDFDIINIKIHSTSVKDNREEIDFDSKLLTRYT